MAVNTRQECGTQHIGVVNCAILPRNVAQADALPLRLAVAPCRCALRSSPERMKSQTSRQCPGSENRPSLPMHRRSSARCGIPRRSSGALGQVENTRLIVEVISPAHATESSRRVGGQPVETQDRLVAVRPVAAKLIQLEICSSEVSKSFRADRWFYAEYGTEIDRKPPDSLLQQLPAELAERHRARPRVQAVERVIGGVAMRSRAVDRVARSNPRSPST